MVGNEQSGNYGHSGRPGERGGSGQGSPLEKPYGGMPGGEHYTAATEYSLSHQRYVEAAHCILGSLGKEEKGIDDEGHIREELAIMEDAVKEYSNPLYNRQLVKYSEDPDTKKYVDLTIQNLREQSPKLVKLAQEGLSKTPYIQNPKVQQLAVDTYGAMITLGQNAEGITDANKGYFNVWNTPEMRVATTRVKTSVDNLYPKKYNRESISSKPIDNRR